jgi:hypothetical protein
MFYLAVVAACLLWSATFIAAAARTERAWLRRLLVAVAIILPPLAVAPWVGLTAVLAFAVGLGTNWFAPTLTAFLAALVGGLWIARGGLSRSASGHVATTWPVVGLAAMCVMATTVAFGTLLFIDNAVAAEGRALRVEAAQIMAAIMPTEPSGDDNAAAVYLPAFAAMDADKTLFANGSPASEPSTADIASPAVADILSRHAATLELVRRAADASGCRFTRDWSRPSFNMLVGETQQLRQAGRLLALAARLEASRGDAEAAIQDIVRVHRVATHAASEPLLVSGLIGQALDTTALTTLAAVLPALGKDDLPLLDDVAFRGFLESSVSYQRHFLGEEAFGLAALADLAHETAGQSTLAMYRSIHDPETPGSLFDRPLSLLYRCFMLPADIAGYRDVKRRFQRLTASTGGASANTLPELEKQAGEVERILKERRAGILSALMVPAITGVLRSQARGEALHAAAKVLVAATRARLATGELPEAAADLVPGRLAALPRDPFTIDKPLLSKRTDDRFLVYSVGPDGEDDGGPAAPGVEPPEGNDDVGLRMLISIPSTSAPIQTP